MITRENVPFSSLTTLRVGGIARFVIDCENKEDVEAIVTFARQQNLPWSVLGEGSNVLAQDEGYEGVVIAMRIQGIQEEEAGDAVILTAGAGVSWDSLVHHAAARGLWGLENLAGIPGTVGAAPVQNIGAYGVEVKDTLTSLEVFNTDTGTVEVLHTNECNFGYRDSRFKHDAHLVILSASFRLLKAGEPNIQYKDLAVALAQGLDLSTPVAIGEAVRSIRARKFPDLTSVGTAGSFFKNPTISITAYESLKERYAAMPGFPNEIGVKIPTAFILDHILNLRGYTEGNVSLFRNQPLVLVASDGATSLEIDTFAKSITARVFDATGIVIEREVRNFPA